MSTVTQAINLTEKLVKAKIPKATALELLDYIETQHGELATKQDIQLVKQDIQSVKQSVNYIWVALSVVVAVMVGGFTLSFTLMLNLHNDTKQDMNKLEDRLEKRFDKLEKLILKQ